MIRPDWYIAFNRKKVLATFDFMAGVALFLLSALLLYTVYEAIMYGGSITIYVTRVFGRAEAIADIFALCITGLLGLWITAVALRKLNLFSSDG